MFHTQPPRSGGDPQGDGRGGTRIHIPAEFKLSHHTGAVNMARVRFTGGAWLVEL